MGREASARKPRVPPGDPDWHFSELRAEDQEGVASAGTGFHLMPLGVGQIAEWFRFPAPVRFLDSCRSWDEYFSSTEEETEAEVAQAEFSH